MHDIRKELDLGGLTMEKVDFSGAREIIANLERIKKECKETYGDDWWEHYKALTNPSPDYDWDEKHINTAIYYGCTPSCFMNAHPEMIAEKERKYEERMKKLFGQFWKRHKVHQPNNSRINRLLINDAKKTGKWKELPDELQEEYHKQMKGDANG